MSSAVTSAPAPSGGAFGLEPGALQALRVFFDATEGLQRVWVFGSRARDDWRARSDLDLALDAPGWSAKDFLRVKERMKDLPIVYPLDVVHWQGVSTPEFVAQIERDRKLLWEPRRGAVSLPRTLGATDLKKFQDESLQKLDAFVSELRARKRESDDLVAATTQFRPWRACRIRCALRPTTRATPGMRCARRARCRLPLLPCRIRAAGTARAAPSPTFA